AEIAVPVLMISHSSWEGNCCFVVPSDQSIAALDALQAELTDDFEKGDVSRLSARNDVILLSGGSDKIYENLARLGVNILVTAHAVAQGGLSLVIANQDEEVALSALRQTALAKKIIPVRKASGHEGIDSPKVSLSY